MSKQAPLQDQQTLTKMRPDWWKGKKVLVTGASGFKGSWLCKTLLKLGAEVYGTISKRISPLSSFYLLDLDQHLIKVDADISNRQQVFDILNSVRPDVIFHLAAKAQVPVALSDPSRAFEVNIMGTINILEGCRQLQIGRRLLVVSTDHVFGDIEEKQFLKGGKFAHGIGERSLVDYSGPYDSSKSAMELCVRSYHYTFWSELPAVGITRAANVFGCGDVGARRVIPHFVQSAITSPHEIVLTCKKNGRQFIHITDVIAGYISAAASLNADDPQTRNAQNFPDREKRQFTPTFHFAMENYEETDEPFLRISNLGSLVANIFGAKVKEDKNCIDFAPNENAVIALNCRETHKCLGWSPKAELAERVAQLGKWYSQKEKPYLLKDMLEGDVKQVLNSL